MILSLPGVSERLFAASAAATVARVALVLGKERYVGHRRDGSGGPRRSVDHNCIPTTTFLL
jgi:hypothetical protein